jgi:HD superfamily phosphodiesterase
VRIGQHKDAEDMKNGRITISEVIEKMIGFLAGNLGDINHFMTVWTYAKTIGELEKIDPETQYILEVAAVIHDISCPLCREKYGNTDGKNQERESDTLVREFLSDSGLSDDQIDRVTYLVSHHHTLTGIDGLDYQILIEADYIANAAENGYSSKNIVTFIDKIMKTEAGKRLTRETFDL